MLRIRLIEQEIATRYAEQEMRCPVHLSIGQEAVAVGVCSHLTASDQVSSAHRSHGHYLAQGGDLVPMLSELYGKATGCCGGRGGSMHLIDRHNGFLGAVPIVGSTLSIGVGFAWAAKLQKTGARTAIFFGEGATEEGAFSESLNLACLHKLPVIFICEDNGFSVYTNLNHRRPENFSFGEYFKSHGADFAEGDGMDVTSVYGLMASALDRLAASSTPQVLYFKTWRYLEHCGPSEDDHLDYRLESELKFWRERDPLALLAKKLSIHITDFSAWEKQISDEIYLEINQTMEQVRNAPFPAPVSLKENLWALRN
jgi:pyruvate dehydrogenase E1 component alpha subunit